MQQLIQRILESYEEAENLGSNDCLSFHGQLSLNMELASQLRIQEKQILKNALKLLKTSWYLEHSHLENLNYTVIVQDAQAVTYVNSWWLVLKALNEKENQMHETLFLHLCVFSMVNNDQHIQKLAFSVSLY